MKLKEFLKIPSVQLGILTVIVWTGIFATIIMANKREGRPFITDTYICDVGATCPHCGERLDTPPEKP